MRLRAMLWKNTQIRAPENTQVRAVDLTVSGLSAPSGSDRRPGASHGEVGEGSGDGRTGDGDAWGVGPAGGAAAGRRRFGLAVSAQPSVGCAGWTDRPGV